MNHLSDYIETLDFIETRIEKMKIKTDKTAVKVAATLFSISIDHAQGIKFCLSNNAYPSAFSLMRILFETYIRGMWLWKCADEKQLNTFINKDKLVSKENKKLNFSTIVLEVEKEHQLETYFSKIKDRTWNVLNSLTHSGSIQLHSNFNGTSIEHHYDDERIDEVIEFSTMLACMSFAGLCDLAKNIDTERESKDLIELVQSWAFNKQNPTH